MTMPRCDWLMNSDPRAAPSNQKQGMSLGPYGLQEGRGLANRGDGVLEMRSEGAEVGRGEGYARQGYQRDVRQPMVPRRAIKLRVK